MPGSGRVLQHAVAVSCVTITAWQKSIGQCVAMDFFRQQDFNRTITVYCTKLR